MGKNIHYNSLAWDILRVVGAGAVVASMLVAPNIGVAFAPFLAKKSAREKREIRTRQIQDALKRLRNRRYAVFEQKGKEVYIKITEHGRQRLRRFDFDTMKLPLGHRRWDDTWRLIAFDIPERKKRERKIFRDKIAALGLFPLQKSLFAYPYPCDDEIDFLTAFLDIDSYVYYIEARTLGRGEGRARRHFDLLL